MNSKRTVLRKDWFYRYVNRNFLIYNGYDMPKFVMDDYYKNTVNKLNSDGIRFFRSLLEMEGDDYNGIKASKMFNSIPGPDLEEVIMIANSSGKRLEEHRKRWRQTTTRIEGYGK